MPLRKSSGKSPRSSGKTCSGQKNGLSRKETARLIFYLFFRGTIRRRAIPRPHLIHRQAESGKAAPAHELRRIFMRPACGSEKSIKYTDTRASAESKKAAPARGFYVRFFMHPACGKKNPEKTRRVYKICSVMQGNPLRSISAMKPSARSFLTKHCAAPAKPPPCTRTAPSSPSRPLAVRMAFSRRCARRRCF